MTVIVHPTAIVDPAARLGANITIGPFCRVGSAVELGDGCKLLSHVVVDGHTRIGRNATIHPFAVLGTEPQDVKYRGEPTELVIGDNATIREHVSINRGTVPGGGVTRIGDNCLFLIGVHVAHDCQIGRNVILANHATLAGAVSVGDFAIFGGLCAIHQFVRIGAHAMVAGMAGVRQDLPPFGFALGNPAWLAGLNLVGLRRRRFPRQSIHRLRAGFRELFHGDGLFAERVARVGETFQDSTEVMAVVEFIRANHRRPVLMPPKGERHAHGHG